MSDPSLYAIAQTLQRLRGQIMRHPAYVKGVGSSPADAEFAKNQREIEEIREGLLTAMRYLKVRGNYLSLQQQVAFKLPRESRWRANQSIKDRSSNLAAVYQLATSILDELSDLESANSRPNIGDILADLAKEGSNIATEAIQVIREHGGHLDNVWVKTTTMQNVPSILIIALIVGQLCARKVRGWQQRAEKGN